MNEYKNVQAASAPGLALTPGDKRAVIDQVCKELGLGGWCCPESGGNFEVSNDDIESEWKRYVDSEQGRELTVHMVALLIATNWERQCVLEDWS
jgi:hypothetical protein